MADFDHGVDLRVIDDLDEYEELVEDGACLEQDILLRLDNPQGLADGTEEGAAWGLDLRSYLSAGMTPRGLLELIVAVELQVEQDDRVDRCRADRSVFESSTLTLTLVLDIEAADGPHLLSIECTPDNLFLLQV